MNYKHFRLLYVNSVESAICGDRISQNFSTLKSGFKHMPNPKTVLLPQKHKISLK